MNIGEDEFIFIYVDNLMNYLIIISESESTVFR